MRHFLPALALFLAAPLARADDIADAANAAMAQGRYADAVVLIREGARLSGGGDAATHGSLAQAYLRADDPANAAVEAGLCFDGVTQATPEWLTVRRECMNIRRRALAMLDAAPAAAPVVTPAASPTTARPTPHPRVVIVHDYAPPVGAVALMAGGGASLVTAAVFAGLRAGSLAPCDVRAETATCASQTDLAGARMAPTWATGANVAAGVGAALLVTGGVVWVLHAIQPRSRVVAGDVGVGVEF